MDNIQKIKNPFNKDEKKLLKKYSKLLIKDFPAEIRKNLYSAGHWPELFSFVFFKIQSIIEDLVDSIEKEKDSLNRELEIDYPIFLSIKNKTNLVYYKYKADKGDTDSKVLLAMTYSDLKDNINSFKYYSEVLEEKDDVYALYFLAIYYLGEYYTDGELPVKKDIKKAIELFTKATQLGDGASAYFLGSLYDEEVEGEIYVKEVEVNLFEAFKWYKLGAELGDKDAMRNLAYAYENGYGTKVDIDKSDYWTNKIEGKAVKSAEIIPLHNNKKVLINTSNEKLSYLSNKSKIKQLIEDGESSTVEFKSSYLWDYAEEDFNKLIRMQVLKAICALINADGGDIIIGVSDNKEIIGIQKDIEYLKAIPNEAYSPDLDSFLIYIKDDIKKELFGGAIIASKIKFYPCEIDDNPLIRLYVKANVEKPIVFPKNRKTPYAGKFFVRESSQTQSYDYDNLEKIVDHLNSRLRDRTETKEED